MNLSLPLDVIKLIITYANFPIYQETKYFTGLTRGQRYDEKFACAEAFDTCKTQINLLLNKQFPLL